MILHQTKQLNERVVVFPQAYRFETSRKTMLTSIIMEGLMTAFQRHTNESSLPVEDKTSQDGN